VTHTLRVRLRPAQYNPTLAKGDIVQVQLERLASSSTAGRHSFFYEVDRIGKARNGEVSLDLTHFPVDADGRSLVAQDVMAAVAGGVLLPTGRAPETISCDVNSPTDPTVPPDPGPPPFPEPDYPEPGEPGGPSDPEGPDGPGAPGVPPLPEDPPYNPIPPEAPELPGGGIGGESGGSIVAGGGRDEKAPEPGDEPEDDPKDPQEPTPVSKPPPGIPIGGPLPQPWIDKVNKAIEKLPPGESLGIDLTDGYRDPGWTITLKRSAFEYTISWSGGSIGSSSDDTYVTVAGVKQVSIRSGYVGGSTVYNALALVQQGAGFNTVAPMIGGTLGTRPEPDATVDGSAPEASFWLGSRTS
jgi:hypothetical protein